MDQYPHSSLPGAGCFAASGFRRALRSEHDVAGNETRKQRLLPNFEVRRAYRHPHDAPSANRRPVQPPFHERLERHGPGRTVYCRFEPHDVDLPVPLLAVEESAPSIKRRGRVGSDKNVRQGANQTAGRGPPRANRLVSQRARLSSLRGSRRNRTMPSARPRPRDLRPRRAPEQDRAPPAEPAVRRTPARAS